MYQECPICNGSGSSRDNQDDACPVCKGHRVIHKDTGQPPRQRKEGIGIALDRLINGVHNDHE